MAARRDRAGDRRDGVHRLSPDGGARGALPGPSGQREPRRHGRLAEAGRRGVPAGRCQGPPRDGPADRRGPARRGVPRRRAARSRAGRGGGAPHRDHQPLRHPQRAGRGRDGRGVAGGVRLHRQGPAALLAGGLHRLQARRGMGRLASSRSRRADVLGREVHARPGQLAHLPPPDGLGRGRGGREGPGKWTGLGGWEGLGGWPANSDPAARHGHRVLRPVCGRVGPAAAPGRPGRPAGGVPGARHHRSRLAGQPPGRGARRAEAHGFGDTDLLQRI
jgi:hypothetical protein